MRVEHTRKTIRHTDLDDFDYDRDHSYIQSLAKAAELAEIESMAIEAALQTHPVTKYVLGVPFERCETYPAISEKHIVNIYNGLLGKKLRKSRKGDISHFPFVHWTLPGQDRSKKKTSGCGVFRSASGDVAVTACTQNRTDYIRAISPHCWSMSCSNCMNSTSLRTAVNCESKILAPVDIRMRKTGQKDKMKHWALSPPQSWMRSVLQRADTFQSVYKNMMQIAELYGVRGGTMLFHPWRLNEDGTQWVVSPHFHVVGYGRWDNLRMRKDLVDLDSQYGIWNDDGKTESWIVENIHPEEEMKSVRHTVGYVLTHVGLGNYQRDVDIATIDEGLVVPIFRNKDGMVELKPRPNVMRDYDWNTWNDPRREMLLYPDVQHPSENFPYDILIDPLEFPHNLNNIDFERYHFERLIGQMRSVRYFGSATKVQNFEIFEEKKVRMCPECGAELGRFGSIHSCTYQLAEYVHRSPIRVMREDYDTVSDFWFEHRQEYSKEGLSVLDFAMSVPQCSTPETAGVSVYEPNKIPEEKKVMRGKKLIYLWCEYGLGFDPVIVTPEEEAELRKRGRVVNIDKEKFDSKII